MKKVLNEFSTYTLLFGLFGFITLYGMGFKGNFENFEWGDKSFWTDVIFRTVMSRWAVMGVKDILFRMFRANEEYEGLQSGLVKRVKTILNSPKSLHADEFIEKTNTKRRKDAQYTKLSKLAYSNNKTIAKINMDLLKKYNGLKELDDGTTKQDILDMIKVNVSRYYRTDMMSTIMENSNPNDEISFNANKEYTKMLIYGLLPAMAMAIIGNQTGLLSWSLDGLTWVMTTLTGIIIALAFTTATTYNIILVKEKQRLERRYELINQFINEYDIK